MAKDYYDILGVTKDASREDVKRAFRHLARKYHPDVNPDKKDAEDKFKEINEAFEVLKDPEKRTAYDQYGEAGLEGTGFDPRSVGGFASFDDLFRDFGFGDIFHVFSGGRKGRSRGPAPGADLKYDLEIGLEETLRDFKTIIEVPRFEKCEMCKGSGAKPGTSQKMCGKCGGSGEVRMLRRTGFMQTVSIALCDNCGGQGTIIEYKCGTCGGAGIEKKTRKIDVKIPAGVDDGQYLRLEGQGETGANGGSSGDLYVVITIREHPVFERHEKDIFCKAMVTLPIIILGGVIEVPTLLGKAKLRIPPGTQSHTVFRMKGQGIPGLHRRERGDQLVKVVVSIPEKMNKRQRELMEEFAKTVDAEKTEIKKGFFERLKEKM